VSASFLGLVIGVVALFFELRSGITNLTVDVVAESNVLDVRASLPELAVLFRGQDIQQENLNLKILAVRLANDGEVNILENHFDSRIPWGLQIERGRLVAVRIMGSNSRYLLDSLHPRLADSSHVILDKVIFDKGKYISLELLVLHNKNIEPQVRAVGKIAGMDEISVSNSFKERDQQGLLSSVFKGPLAVQIARTIAYFVVGFFASAVVGISIAAIVGVISKLKKRSRRRLVRYLVKADSPEKEVQRQAVLEIFVEQGVPGLKRARAILKDEQMLRTAIRAANHLTEISAGTSDSRTEAIMQSVAMEGPVLVYDSTIAPLIREHLVRIDENSVQVDPNVPEFLSAFIAQLSDVGNDGSAKPD